MAHSTERARAFIGISGYNYKGWRSSFYPPRVPVREWLAYASRQFNTIELNGTFYSLKTPAVYRRWVSETPDGFVFAVKGSRFITHNLKLGHPAQALANFYASGILELGDKTGPFLWQLPPTYPFDQARLEGFLRLLPGNSSRGARLALQHDRRVPDPAVKSAVRMVYRHAVEFRHPSYFGEECYALLRKYGVALVIADTAGKFPYAEVLTANFVYVRLHGSQALYASRYSDAELDSWTKRLVEWSRDSGRNRRDLYVYFDNDAHAHAPHDALRLAERVRSKGIAVDYGNTLMAD
jgi:uncharacterized protein YecE (DUF72 family)